MTAAYEREYEMPSSGTKPNGAQNGARKPERPAWTSGADRARAVAIAPPPRRLPVAGMPTLERCTRNGVPEGSSVTLTAPPGSLKSGLVLQWAHEWAVTGARVAVLCTDQGPDKAISRVGERMGLERDHLEGIAGEGERRVAWQDLARELEALPNLAFLDGGEDAVTIEGAAEILDSLPGDGPRVLIVDSIQEATCASLAAAAAEGLLSRIPRRDQIDTAGRVCRRIARRGVLVVLVSEMSRGGYGGDAKRRTAALASSKESGSIEYRADVLLVLQRLKSDPDVVDVAMPKCRLGEEADFRLKIDRRRASLVEVPKADPASSRRGAQAAVRAEVQADAVELARVLTQHPAGLGTRALRSQLIASGLRWGPTRIDAARTALEAGVNGMRVVDRTPSGRSRQWAVERFSEAHGV